MFVGLCFCLTWPASKKKRGHKHDTTWGHVILTDTKKTRLQCIHPNRHVVTRVDLNFFLSSRHDKTRYNSNLMPIFVPIFGHKRDTTRDRVKTIETKMTWTWILVSILFCFIKCFRGVLKLPTLKRQIKMDLFIDAIVCMRIAYLTLWCVYKTNHRVKNYCIHL